MAVKYVVKIVSSIEEKKSALQVRKIVFVEEQNVPEELEYDEYDEQVGVEHFIVLNPANKVIGTARLRAYETDNGKVQRLAILADYRGIGVGSLLMQAVEAAAITKGFNMLKLEAQLQARSFYERLGYEARGSVFSDANIKHINMIKKII